MDWLTAWERERDEREEANVKQRLKTEQMNKGECACQTIGDGQEVSFSADQIKGSGSLRHS